MAGAAVIDRKPLLAAFVAVALIIGFWHPVDRAHASGDYEQVVDLTFPMAGDAEYYYKDGGDYHDWRNKSTGRRHQATDILADRATPVHAAVGGTIDVITGMGCGWHGYGDKDEPPSWGYAIYIEGDDGRRYVYIHLGRQDGPASEAYADGLTCGSRVERGEHIGYVGDSGYVLYKPHLHFEIHDDHVTDPYDYHDHERIDPYYSLRDAEARGDFPGFEPAKLTSGTVALTGDWNGDGVDRPGWYADGRFYLRTPDGGAHAFNYGVSGDLPIVGDWDGDGVDTVGIVRDGVWHLRNANKGGVADLEFKYGRVLDGDYPLAGDWDGDGVDTVGIVRDGEWHLRNRNTGGPGELVYIYGRILSGDIPTTGDWNGDGQDTPAIVRGREWHLREEHRGGPADVVFKYGISDDVPVAGDWDTNGTDTPGVVRDRQWLLRKANSGGGAHLTVGF